MNRCRIHLTGASGSGVTTLGHALASEFAIPHHDTDDYYWLPTDPPFRHKRAIPDRLRLMHEMFLDRPAWVLSGALESWGTAIADRFDLVILVQTSTSTRIERLRRREAMRHGFSEIRGAWPVLPETEAFLRWAAEYDSGGLSERSLLRHRVWLESLTCQVLTVDGGRPTAELVEMVKTFRERACRTQLAQ